MTDQHAQRPTLEAVVRAAVDATGADRGWLLRAESTDLIVAAAVGDGSATLVGTRRGTVGIAGMVIASGQPAAVRVAPSDVDNHGAGGALGRPKSILAVPCIVDEILGVLEVVDAPGGAFSFDDVEMVAFFADIAGAALSENPSASTPLTPTAVAASLSALAASDPRRYAQIARAVEAML